jgi:hypothetical protein
MLRIVDWWLVTDVSGQLTGPSSMVKQSKAVQQFCLDCDTLLGSHFASVEQPWLEGGGIHFDKCVYMRVVLCNVVERNV